MHGSVNGEQVLTLQRLRGSRQRDVSRAVLLSIVISNKLMGAWKVCMGLSLEFVYMERAWAFNVNL